jgi:hypothetical protein
MTTGENTELDALWHLDEWRAFLAGPLDYDAGPQHGAPVYLAGGNPLGRFYVEPDAAGADAVTPLVRSRSRARRQIDRRVSHVRRTP